MLHIVYHIIKQYTVALYSASQYGKKDYHLGQGLKLRKYFRGQVGPHQINFGSPHNLLGAHQARMPATSLARCPTAGGLLKAPGSPGINGVKSCILAISRQQNWPFRNYNLIQKIINFQNIFLKINLFYMHQDFRNL